MKPPLSFAFALVLAILAGTLQMILAHGQATPNVVLQSRFKLTPFPTPASLMPGELACPFFLWTKDFTPEQRISFNYVDSRDDNEQYAGTDERNDHHRFKGERSGRDDE